MSKFQVLVPQKARGKLVESMWHDPDWQIEEKFDGERRIAQFVNGVVRFTGTPSKKTGKPVEKTDQLPHLSGAGFKHKGRMTATEAQSHRYPPDLEGTVLDGELIKPVGLQGRGGESKYVTAISNSLPAEAIRKQQEKGWLRYVVFDCLFWLGRDVRDLPLVQRRAFARQAVDRWGNLFVKVNPSWAGGRVAYEEIIDRGGEGVVLKYCDHRYGDQKAWVKVKKVKTYDCVIMGYKQPKLTSKKSDGTVSYTKLANKAQIGAVVIGQNYKMSMKAGSINYAEVVEVGTISGMDDAQRAEFSKHGKKYIGTVVEITANGREPTGRFRHPQFSRLRPDKRAEECVYDQEES
jgi:ATP-dependent DNA ligase